MIKGNLELYNSINTKSFKSHLIQKLSLDFKKIEKNVLNEINDPTKTLNILNKNYKFNFKLSDLKKFKKYKNVAIIGMGGSILGSDSIYNFLRTKIKKNFHFFDNLDSNMNSLFKKKKLDKILFIVISKSGKTVETLANFLNLKILKNNAKNIIIISEKKNNPLYMISKKFNLFYVEHKKSIGGRYSVLSEVGILPAYLMGINTKKFRSNVRNFLKGKKKLFLKDSVVKLSHLLIHQKIKTIVFLNYTPKLEKFLYWCQQLIAESLGKKGKGFLPIISNAPKDHHSLLQLYLDGPRDKIFYIFSASEKTKEKVKTNIMPSSEKFFERKNLEVIKDAQKIALINIFKNKKIPYREFKIKNINEQNIGEMFSYYILETIFLGKLIKINPFNQPAVEQVKILTKKILN